MSAKRQETGKPKRKAPSTAWKKGQSGNPAGRPKDGESWAAIIKAVGDMYTEDVLEMIGETSVLGRKIKTLPRSVQLKYLVISSVYLSLALDPQSGLWTELMNRAEGKVKEQLQVGGTLNVENLDAMLKKVYGSSSDDQSGRDSTTNVTRHEAGKLAG